MTRLDKIIVVVGSIVVLWYGVKWTFTAKGLKKPLGAFMLVIALANVLKFNGVYSGLLTGGLKVENSFYQMLSKKGGQQSAKGA